MSTGNPIEHSIAVARRRVFLQMSLQALGWAALFALAIAAAVMVAGRLCAVPVEWWVYAILAGIAVVVAPLIGWTRRPGVVQTATLIDERLGLKDRLATALYAETIPNDPFARRAIDDAKSAAGGLHLGRVFRIRFTRVWGWVPVAAGVFTLLLAFTPAMDLLGIGSQRSERLARQAVAKQSQADVAKTVNAVEKLKETEPALNQDKKTRESLAELAELSKKDLRDPAMRKSAAAKLSKVEENLGETAEQKEREARAMQNALSRTDPQVSGPADKFADALRRGDYEQAQNELRELSRVAQSGRLSESEKQAAGKQLENIARQLEESARESEAQQEKAREQAEQALENAGLSKDQIEQIKKQGMTAEQIKEALQNQGAKPSQAQQTAQRAAEKANEAKTSEKTAQGTRSLSQPLQKMSESICQGGGSAPSTQPAASKSSNNQNAAQAQKDPTASQDPNQPATPAGGECQSACDRLSDMGQAASQAKGAREAQAAARKAIQSMTGRENDGSTRTPLAARGGSKAGTGSGGPAVGEEQKLAGYQTEASSDMNPREGRVIASWMSEGEIGKGEAKITYNQAVTEAKQEAEKAVTDDRVPRKYHGPIKEYFDQMPTTPDGK